MQRQRDQNSHCPNTYGPGCVQASAKLQFSSSLTLCFVLIHFNLDSFQNVFRAQAKETTVDRRVEEDMLNTTLSTLKGLDRTFQ